MEVIGMFPDIDGQNRNTSPLRQILVFFGGEDLQLLPKRGKDKHGPSGAFHRRRRGGELLGEGFEGAEIGAKLAH